MKNKLTAYLPLVSAYIIFLGILKQILFFKEYNIDIKHFISLSEIGLIVSDDLLIVMIILISLWLLAKYTIREVNEEDKDPRFKNYNKKIIKSDRRNANIFFFSAIAFFTIFAIWQDNYTGYLVLFFGIAPPVVILLLKNNVHLFDNISVLTFNAKELFYSTLLISAVSIKTVFDINVVNNGFYEGSVITIDSNTTITSCDTSIYIGRTSNYVFIYKPKLDITDVIPSERIKQISITITGYDFSFKKKVSDLWN